MRYCFIEYLFYDLIYDYLFISSYRYQVLQIRIRRILTDLNGNVNADLFAIYYFRYCFDLVRGIYIRYTFIDRYVFYIIILFFRSYNIISQLRQLI